MKRVNIKHFPLQPGTLQSSDINAYFKTLCAAIIYCFDIIQYYDTKVNEFYIFLLFITIFLIIFFVYKAYFLIKDTSSFIFVNFSDDCWHPTRTPVNKNTKLKNVNKRLKLFIGNLLIAELLILGLRYPITFRRKCESWKRINKIFC